MVCNGSFVRFIIYLLFSAFIIPNPLPSPSPLLLNPIFLDSYGHLALFLPLGLFCLSHNALLLSHPTRASQVAPLSRFFWLSQDIYLPFASQFPGNPWTRLQQVWRWAHQPHLLLRVPQGHGFPKKLLLLVTSSLSSKDPQRQWGSMTQSFLEWVMGRRKEGICWTKKMQNIISKFCYNESIFFFFAKLKWEFQS